MPRRNHTDLGSPISSHKCLVSFQSPSFWPSSAWVAPFLPWHSRMRPPAESPSAMKSIRRREQFLNVGMCTSFCAGNEPDLTLTELRITTSDVRIDEARPRLGRKDHRSQGRDRHGFHRGSGAWGGEGGNRIDLYHTCCPHLGDDEFPLDWMGADSAKFLFSANVGGADPSVEKDEIVVSTSAPLLAVTIGGACGAVVLALLRLIYRLLRPGGAPRESMAARSG